MVSSYFSGAIRVSESVFKPCALSVARQQPTSISPLDSAGVSAYITTPLISLLCSPNVPIAKSFFQVFPSDIVINPMRLHLVPRIGKKRGIKQKKR